MIFAMDFALNSLLVLCTFANFTSASLNNILHNYETLHHDTFQHHIARRDLYSEHPEERQVEFDSFGRHFHLILHKVSTPLFSPHLKVFAVDASNKERVVDFRPTIYHGYLEDEPDTSSVSAYWEDKDVMSLSVNTTSELYVVEPSWRHLPKSSNYSMISYRGSDIKMEEDLGKSFCGFVNPPQTATREEKSQDNIHTESGARRKRSSSCTTYGKTTCTLLLVADYKFYQYMGLNSIATTTSYMFLQIDRINEIYRRHSFGSCGKGFGFEIKEIRVHTNPTMDSSRLHYNANKTDWETTGLLEAFSDNSNNAYFCLAHLFTAIGFQSGTLGLSYVASARVGPGGLCSKPYDEKGGRTLYLNTGWSSSLNRYERRLLTQEAMLVTAHGHNWGSEHDPDTLECAPPAAGGGKYIMYTYSVSGIDPNNKIFSPCSLRSIGQVLNIKADSCFKQPSGSFCGNSVVEKDEQCDAGADQADKCCDQKCQLRPRAKCSDANEICCQDCNFAPKTKICLNGQNALCVGNATCSGNSTVCLPAPWKTNGSACLENGRCVNGSCVSLCEFSGKIPCVCDTVANSCKWCCRDKNDVNKTCEPYGNNSLPSGMPCVQGFCHEGVCQKQIHDTIQRLWDIIENITVDKLVMFMRANIVGTVIILSLVIWIPLSCVVACVDRRRANEEKQHLEWLNNENTNLIRDEEINQLTIRRVDKPKSRNLKLYIPPRAHSSSTSAPDSVFQ